MTDQMVETDGMTREQLCDTVEALARAVVAYEVAGQRQSTRILDLADKGFHRRPDEQTPAFAEFARMAIEIVEERRRHDALVFGHLVMTFATIDPGTASAVPDSTAVN